MRLFALLILIFMGVLGCSSQPYPLTAINGRVYFQKNPVAGGTVVFIPDPARGSTGPMAVGEILVDGSFAIQPMPGKEPIHPGWYRVTLASASPLLPAKYSDPGQSGQVREVKGGVTNNFEFYLE